MPISKAQLEDRKNHLGASDIPAIMGVDPFKTAYDVWLDKTGKLEPQAQTKVMLRGNLLETPILDWFHLVTGLAITRNQKRSAKSRGIPIASNCDAIVNASGDPVEAKSQGCYSNETWGAEGTDEVPDRIILQAHAQMICTGAKMCHIPAYLAYREFALFIVNLNPELKDLLIQEAINFWEQHVEKDIPPQGNPSVGTVSRVIRTPNKTVTVDPDLILRYKACASTVTNAKKLQNEAKAELLAALGDAECGDAGDGLTCTYFSSDRKGYTVEPKTMRVIRFPKAKKS
jgi:putative phage-type endonuclease